MRRKCYTILLLYTYVNIHILTSPKVHCAEYEHCPYIAYVGGRSVDAVSDSRLIWMETIARSETFRLRLSFLSFLAPPSFFHLPDTIVVQSEVMADLMQEGFSDHAGNVVFGLRIPLDVFLKQRYFIGQFSAEFTMPLGEGHAFVEAEQAEDPSPPSNGRLGFDDHDDILQHRLELRRERIDRLLNRPLEHVDIHA